MHSEPSTGAAVADARRRFLINCGKFAVATPPAISLLLAAAKTNYAVASSGSNGSSSSSGSGGGNAPLVSNDMGGNPPGGGDPPSGGNQPAGGNPSGGSTLLVNSPVGGTASSHNCGNAFNALVNNDKCFR